MKVILQENYSVGMIVLLISIIVNNYVERFKYLLEKNIHIRITSRIQHEVGRLTTGQ